jgi:RNA polymerase sigma-70 factor (ECF subfamily)
MGNTALEQEGTLSEEEARLKLAELHADLDKEVRSWVRGRLCARARCRHDVEDITQDIWLRVALSFARFDPRRGHARNWVYRITLNSICDRLRAFDHVELSTEDQPEMFTVLPSAGVDDPGVVLPPRLRARLAALGESDRALVRICALEGRPTTEAARELGLTASAARKRWCRIRRRLAAGTASKPRSRG